jgi:FAD/FMN-containing dehydrogenase
MPALQATTITGERTVLEETEVKEFQTRLRGRLLRPSDNGYDDARKVWNAMIDRRPALIARCTGAADVLAAVTFAREQDLLVSIRGGGHNVSGNAICDGALMIDLAPMKGIRVDPVARTARAEPGLLWGEFDRETQAFGLATTGGLISTTGIAGLTLGGGQGWLAGKHGFTIDNLLSVDVVTATGQLLTANATQHEDLFWAMRGAGHNFGVVTSFEYQLHPVSTVLGGMVVHPTARVRDVLRFYREFTADPPDELTTGADILTGSDGDVMAAIAVCYVGSLDEGERVLAPLRRFGPPVADTIAPIPYTAQQTMLDEAFPYGRLNYWKSSLTDQLSDEVIAALVDFTGRMPSPLSSIPIGDFHGVYRRVDKTVTAYYHRDLRYDIVIGANWTDPADTERNVRWTREFYEALQPHLPHGVYVNDLDHDEGSEQVRHAYGENYERLVTLKKKYDPTNFFRVNQNIKPMTA